MKITSESKNNIAIIKIEEGFISFSEYEEFVKTYTPFLEKNYKNFVIDLKDLEIISSTGIGGLISLKKKTSAEDGFISLCGMQKMIFSVIKTTGLHEIFDVSDTVEEALEKIPS